MATKAERRAQRKSRRRQPSKARAAYIDDSDNSSICSSQPDSYFGGSEYGDYDDGPDHVVDTKFQLEGFLDQLSEKRTATRVSALKNLIEFLSKDVQDELLIHSHVTLSTNLASLLRKSSGNELVLAIRTFAISCITLGSSADGAALFGDISPLVERVAKTSKTSAARCEALKSLAIGCCLSTESQKDHFKYMEFLSEFWRYSHNDQTQRKDKLPPKVICAALQGWGLLASYLPFSIICTDYMNDVLPEMRRLLDHTSLDVKIASGENIALIYSSYYDWCDVPRDDEEEEEFVEMNDSDIMEVLEYLAKDGTKSKGKKERKEQKAKFREILGTVQSMENPKQTVTVDDERLTFEGWPDSIQLANLRNALKTGFHAHFNGNEFIRSMFHINTSEKSKTTEDPLMAKAGKHVRMAEFQDNSRSRYDARKQNRKKKNAFQYSDY